MYLLGRRKKETTKQTRSESRVMYSQKLRIIKHLSCCFGKDCGTSLDFLALFDVYFRIMVIGKGEFHWSADKSLAKGRDG